MRSYLSELVGNAALRARIGEDIAKGSFSHAYILEGDEGSGKHTLARAIAMSLACENRQNGDEPLPCGHCRSCRKILSGNCPDILYVKREEDRATMGVNVIRELRTDVPVLPNDLDFKIYLIEEAHLMTPQAQNAFLLTLEEPPKFVLFLLLANDASVLLETVRSRAPVLRLQPIGDDMMRDYLLSPERPAVARSAKALAEQHPSDFAALLRMSDGRIGRALTLLEEKKRAPLLARRDTAQKVCELLSHGNGGTELLSLLYAFDKSREEATERLTCIRDALRDLLALTLSDTAPLVFFTDREAAEDLSIRFTSASILSRIKATDEALHSLSINANVRLTLTRYHNRLTA